MSHITTIGRWSTGKAGARRENQNRVRSKPRGGGRASHDLLRRVLVFM